MDLALSEQSNSRGPQLTGPDLDFQMLCTFVTTLLALISFIKSSSMEILTLWFKDCRFCANLSGLLCHKHLSFETNVQYIRSTILFSNAQFCCNIVLKIYFLNNQMHEMQLQVHSIAHLRDLKLPEPMLFLPAQVQSLSKHNDRYSLCFTRFNICSYENCAKKKKKLHTSIQHSSKS